MVSEIEIEQDDSTSSSITIGASMIDGLVQETSQLPFATIPSRISTTSLTSSWRTMDEAYFVNLL